MNDMLKKQPACPLANGPELSGTLDEVLRREWLLADGLGGFASSTVIGCPTRRYHGLLVASKRPPLERFVLLANALDRVTVGEVSVDLSTFEFGDVFHPTGYKLLSGFAMQTAGPDPWVELAFSHDLFEARKRITLCTGRRAVKLSYEVVPRRAEPVRLEVSPFGPLRDFHSMLQRDAAGPWELCGEHDAVWIQMRDNHEVTLALLATAGNVSWQTEPDWWFNFRYRVECERGFNQSEDLLKVGTFRAEGTGRLACELAAVGFVGSVAAGRDVLHGPAWGYTGGVCKCLCDDPAARRLLTAANQFVVHREPRDGREGSATVLAGYPWFGDWGRDSFIALEGLLLIPGKYDEACQVLATFAGAQRNGLIPNRFDDYGGQCAYNSVDASLWFIHAADAYLRYSGDLAALDDFLLDACRNVIHAFCEGTEQEIGVDDRGLVCCGNAETQITWMDAKCDGVVFTQRHGRPVEVNALWYHALHLVAEHAQGGDPALAQHCRDLIRQIEASFEETFWNEAAACLFDCVRDDWSDPAIRPNQVFAVSLAHSPLSPSRRQKVWEVVTEELLTPMGLRTLSREHRRYVARYSGGPFERDQAYHNGTVWSWLMGPYVEAHLRVHGFTTRAKRYARKLLQPLVDHMSEAGLGSISEIFDAEAPHTPRGCIAQAWSVAEVLRAWKLTEPQPELPTSTAPRQFARPGVPD